MVALYGTVAMGYLGRIRTLGASLARLSRNITECSPIKPAIELRGTVALHCSLTPAYDTHGRNLGMLRSSVIFLPADAGDDEGGGNDSLLHYRYLQ